MPYPWGDERRFNSYAAYFKRTFGSRMQKVTINAGFSCPNRDGKLSTGGCTFCRNDAFTPSYCQSEKSITQQIDEGIEFHRRRYRTAQRYLAYFQSFSNTYAPLERLRECYDEALAHPDIAGIVVGTRPDCIDEEKLDYFAELAKRKYVIIEYGVESCYDATLKRINRGHDFATAERAIRLTAERGIHCGAHFILGLPGESDEMLIEQVEKINSLPLTTIKFHQLQLFKDTPMAREYDLHPEEFRFWTVEEYIELFVEIVRRLRPDIVIERFAGEAPPRYHHLEGWGLVRNETLLMMLDKELERKNVHQGDIFNIFAPKFQ
ncbi:MAG: TIGR01212 family radical SAM protein [Alistipes sp.]|nr:TIGR01212 family radical SAM protein [Alistipes sp.]